MKTHSQRRTEALARRENDLKFWEDAPNGDPTRLFRDKTGRDWTGNGTEEWQATCRAKAAAAKRDVEALRRKLGV